MTSENGFGEGGGRRGGDRLLEFFGNPTRGGCRPPGPPTRGQGPWTPTGASRPQDLLARFMSLSHSIMMSYGHKTCLENIEKFMFTWPETAFPNHEKLGSSLSQNLASQQLLSFVARLSLARSLARSVGRLLDRSLARSIARSLDRSFAH